MNKVLPYSYARQNLASVMEDACQNRTPVTITRRRGGAVVLMSLEEYNALDETAHLLRVPANAAHLRRGLKAAAKGRFVAHELIEPARAPKAKTRKTTRKR